MIDAMWDPGVYAAHGDLRLRPALELLARTPGREVRRVLDLGCGAGAVAGALRRRFPDAEIVGVDPSSEMLAKAAAIGVYDATAAGDAASVAAGAETFDVIFANAALQWATDHATLAPALMTRLAPGGALSVQMPRMAAEPSHTLLAAASVSVAPDARVAAQPGALTPGAYVAILEPAAASLDVWETVYQQILPACATGAHPVRTFTEGAAARPFLQALGAERRDAFFAAYDEFLEEAYPRRADGSALFAFRRLFFVATAAA